MFRYYLDSNVYQLLKKEHPFHRADLKAMMDNIQDDVLIFYSDAHFDDLKNSKQEYRDVDLELIGIYAKNNYFTTEIKGSHELNYLLVDPITAFGEKNYNAVDEFFNNPNKFSELLDDLGDSPEATVYKDIINMLFDRPLNFFNPQTDLETLESPHDKWLSKLMPGYSNGTTLRQFFAANLDFSSRFNNDPKEFAELRNYVGQYMNRDDFSWDIWKTKFNARFKDTNLRRTFKELIETMLLDSQKSDLYLRIVYMYSLLETYGITQERTKRGIKKNTYQSIYQDAYHVFYASFTDCLVTEDKGMQLKAHIIYQLLNYGTEVLTIDEFISRQHQIKHKDSYDSFVKLLNYDLEHSMQLYSTPDLETSEKNAGFKTTIPYFRYFNRYLTATDTRVLTFYCSRKAPKANFYMFHEIRIVAESLFSAFGEDDDKRGPYNIIEKGGVDYLRRWTIGIVHFELATMLQSQAAFVVLRFWINRV